MTYHEVLQSAIDMLLKHEIEDASIDAWIFMEEVTSYKRAEFILNETKQMPKEASEKYFGWVRERCKHIPLQYILGYTEFMGLRFLVNNKVLIPRQETELLADKAGKYAKGKKVLDMCTGSGCIIISLVKLYGVKEAAGADISLDAIMTAKKNAGAIGADVNFIHGNLFDEITEKYDIIVSNPPYIKTDDIDMLMPEVRLHEPRIALDGMKDGLWFYREIISKAPEYLNQNGSIMLEIGYDQAEEVTGILHVNGFTDIEVYKDYSGNDRILSARL